MAHSGRLREVWKTLGSPFLVCVVALVLATKGIMSEATIAFNGDMPRYLMNGVYLLDLLRDGVAPADAMHHARLYFAQYPALSLGHHPVLLPMAEVPFFAALGISVSTGRIAILFILLLGLLAWFYLIKAIWGEKVAFWSSLLLASSPLVVSVSRMVMSEIPVISLTIAAFFFYYRFAEHGKTRDLALLAVSVVLACYAKQMAVFVLPVFALHYAFRRGFKALFAPRLLAALAVVGGALIPLAWLTLRFSSANVTWVVESNTGGEVELPIRHAVYFLRRLWEDAYVAPVVALSFLGIAAAFVFKHRQAALFILWIAVSAMLVIYVRVLEARMAVYFLPPFALFAVLSAELVSSASLGSGVVTAKRAGKVLWGLVFALTAYQIVSAYAADPEYTEGYEEAARFVAENRKGTTILFSSSVDTGYFVFFARKHDPQRELIIMRANKVLATSHYNQTVDDQISDVDEIYQMLRDYGTCHIVTEDRDAGSRALNWLREELDTDRFILRKRIALKTTERRLQGVSLLIHEYKDCTAPRLDAPIDMNVPLGGMSINMRLGDLLK